MRRHMKLLHGVLCPQRCSQHGIVRRESQGLHPLHKAIQILKPPSHGGHHLKSLFGLEIV